LLVAPEHLDHFQEVAEQEDLECQTFTVCLLLQLHLWQIQQVSRCQLHHIQLRWVVADHQAQQVRLAEQQMVLIQYFQLSHQQVAEEVEHQDKVRVTLPVQQVVQVVEEIITQVQYLVEQVTHHQ
tara:strand:- start:231 stop:605 length:375 start_codon:yes stop_codon:yes gene_type:complete